MARPRPPDRTPVLARGRVDLERGRSASRALRSGDQPAVIGAAVAVVTAVGDDHAAAVERERRALQERRVIGARRVHRDRETGDRSAAGEVQREQLVVDRAAVEHVRDGVDATRRGIDRRGAGDADRRGDVAAGQIAGRHRRPQRALPQHGAGRGVQGIDAVVLGGDVDDGAGDQRLGIHGAVDLRRPPRRGGSQGGAAVRVGR